MSGNSPGDTWVWVSVQCLKLDNFGLEGKCPFMIHKKFRTQRYIYTCTYTQVRAHVLAHTQHTNTVFSFMAHCIGLRMGVTSIKL